MGNKGAIVSDIMEAADTILTLGIYEATVVVNKNHR